MRKSLFEAGDVVVVVIAAKIELELLQLQWQANDRQSVESLLIEWGGPAQDQGRQVGGVLGGRHAGQESGTNARNAPGWMNPGPTDWASPEDASAI